MPITPEQLAAPGDEHAHQVAFFQWISLHGSKSHPEMLLTHSIPNGSKLMGVGTKQGMIEGAKMKAEGLRAGVPDVFCPVVMRHERWGVIWPGLWIEFKKPGRFTEKNQGRSDEQVRWQRELAAQGYAVATAYGWQAGTRVLASYWGRGFQIPSNGDCHFELETERPAW